MTAAMKFLLCFLSSLGDFSSLMRDISSLAPCLSHGPLQNERMMMDHSTSYVHHLGHSYVLILNLAWPLKKSPYGIVEYLHASFDDRKIMVASCCHIHEESDGRWWRPDTFVSEKKHSEGYGSFLYHVGSCVWPEIWQHSCYIQKGFHGVSHTSIWMSSTHLKKQEFGCVL